MVREGKNQSQHRRLKNVEGTIVYLFENKLHNWEGPAYIPQGDESLAEYHLFGIPYTKDEWKAAIRDHTGLPWFK
tara:strand:- start:150 stop:374 length:225 start_codon:yes stop_codon:yes gene_type:complete